MKHHEWPTGMYVLFMVLFLSPLEALALRCGHTLVSEGDRKVEVAMKCGEPALIEKWEEEVARYKKRGERITSSVRTQEVEEWTYNFGPHKFLQFLRFMNGKLESITEGSYGFDGPIPADSDKIRCGAMVEKSDRKIDVIKKCGEPTFKESRTEERQIGTYTKNTKEKTVFSDGLTKIIIEESDGETGREKNVIVHVDTWTYNFGPHLFLSFITFENGRVKEIEQKGYGY